MFNVVQIAVNMRLTPMQEFSAGIYPYYATRFGNGYGLLVGDISSMG
ncbi:hypothetical protein SDC9_161963 [bioreactor metagenome]|uniref:Uncharacterized protein n=1 Tax=bioreactor metagenome TaxID=1076179 RepID=A0A645FLV0_9ZZZZ